MHDTTQTTTPENAELDPVTGLPPVTSVHLPDGRELTPEEAAKLDAGDLSALLNSNDLPRGVFFTDAPNFLPGTIIINDGHHAPEWIRFGELDDDLQAEVEAMPEYLARQMELPLLDIKTFQDLETLLKNVPAEKIGAVVTYIRDLYKKVRLGAIKEWGFEAPVSAETIEKLPRTLRTELAGIIIGWTMSGARPQVFVIGAEQQSR